MKKKLLLILAIFKIATASAQTIGGAMLDINNIKAGIYTDGTLFMDSTSSYFEVPQGSGKQTIFASNLWIGAHDSGGNLLMSAQTYRQLGVDFFAGPLDTANVYGASYDSTFNRVWKINKCDINAYSNWISAGSIGSLPVFQDTTAMEVINHWPAYNMYGQSLAPFTDINSDGIYDPSVGDVPLIKGDQAVFFVYNDSRATHTETGGTALGLEIQGMAYAYNCNADTAINNTIFTHYKIVNKTNTNKDSVYIGNWTDFDIGYYNDDFIGCDVTRGAYFGYNGSLVDGSGQSGAYGANPPAQAVVFLKGPLTDANGIDEPQNTYVNALNCGDSIIDNERLGMSHFMYFNNNSNSVSGNPTATDDYYQYLSGSWKDGSSWTFDNDGASGTMVCDYMFPGTSDPYGYGLGGSISNPVSLSDWDEFSENNPSGDRRGLGAFGPFTLNAGVSTELDFAYVYGRATTGGNLASVAVLKSQIDSVKHKFITAPNNVIAACSCDTVATGINTIKSVEEFVLFPNPASDKLTINYNKASLNTIASIYDVTGNLVKKSNLSTSLTNSISVKELPAGLYILKLQDGERVTAKRFVKQ